jgi:2-dehydro-3-deoxy-D-arabinonate dehydratase
MHRRSGETDKVRLYRNKHGLVAEHDGKFYNSNATLDDLIGADDLEQQILRLLPSWKPVEKPDPGELCAPVGSQEVWAAGVTYFRSRTARMEESKSAAGGDFYDRVYHAERPELFFKSTAERVVGPNQKVAIRNDAKWSVPEPELALLVNPAGKIVGYTAANDMSSRDIEGENPLYLPQAKVYDRSCAIGPAILASNRPIDTSTEIRMEILRGGATEFSDSITLASMKRTLDVLVEYLYRNTSFPHGCFLLTGTGIVPPDAFTLHPGDEIRISIAGIGTLVNHVG